MDFYFSFKTTYMAQNEKQRKSEAQEIHEQAENAGRFAGDSPESQAALEQSVENIRQDTGSSRQERDKGDNEAAAEGGTDRNQGQDTAGDAQNVEDDGSGRLEGGEAERARNKATEGQRQGRDS
jgi:hypothetical protein